MGWLRKIAKPFETVGKKIGHGAERTGKWAGDGDTLKKAFMPGAVDPITGMAIRGLGGPDLRGGQKDDPIFGGAKKEAVRKAEIEERAAQAKAKADEAALLDRANAAYGVGLSPEAQANASRINARRAAAENQAFTGGQQAADQQYGQGLSEIRGNMARSGTLGGGAEGQARTDLMSQYFGTMNQAQQAGNQAGIGIDTAANTNRLALRAGVRGGQIKDATGLGSEIAGLDAQGTGANLWASSMGRFLPTAAGIYKNNQMGQAYGST